MVEVKTGSVDLIITSPPYLNNFDYAEMTRMHLYFLGMASSWSDISEKVRAKLIVNTTTALKGHKNNQDKYKNSLPNFIVDELIPIVNSLANAKNVKAGKKEYNLLVYPYFAQMQNVLRECGRVLKKGRHFHMMVADAALYGIHISTPQIISVLIKNLGFRQVECTQVRQRGHRWILEKREGSPNGLGEYHIFAVR
jgi:DNA modification methylase